MSFDGSGNFTLTNSQYTGDTIWTQAANAGEKVRADRFDAFSVDLKNALQLAVLRDGQNSPTANLPMAGRKHTNVADGAARTEYATKGQLDDASAQFVSAANVGGSANAITLTPSTPVTTLTAGVSFRFIVESNNTGAVTVAVSGGSPVALTKNGDDALEEDDLVDGALVQINYDGTRFQLDGGAGAGDLGDIGTISVLTQAQYDALTTKVTDTLYLVTG